MIVGMDFGTTNTRAAIYSGDQIHLLPLDPANSTPHICRSSIYITRSRDYYLGSSALNLYFNQNVGRPTRYKKVWVGEIMQVYAELPTFYRDVYVYEDEFSPGRLFLSIKTALRNQGYYGTIFRDNWYSASDLAAIFLLGMKMQMEKHLERPVRELVLGRPVLFSNDPTEDQVAQSRLVEAAFKAGFEKVYLEYEPVAAALAYERTIRDKETVLVFDFGGGTLDFTIMEIGDPRKRRVLATGGIPVAGDLFDQRLFRATIPQHLGEGDYFLSGGSRYPIPAHIFDLLTSPQEVLSLNTPQNLEMLRSIHQGALHKEKTRALLSIVSSNYALFMFDRIEQAKRRLSEETDTTLTFETRDFHIEENITRLRFERSISHEYTAVKEELERTISRAGLTYKEIDRVIRTGGSSQIPLFTRMLNRTFGYQKVQEIDIFNSVTSGLAIRGQEIASGKSELRAYTPGENGKPEKTSYSPSKSQEVRQIDLEGVFQRMQVAKDYREGLIRLPDQVLFSICAGKLRTHSISSDPENWAKDLPDFGKEEKSPVQCIPASIDEILLLATNLFKLISVPVRSLLVAEEAGREGIFELLGLEAGEMVACGVVWNPSNPAKELICMVTVEGQARALNSKLMAEQLNQKPYFQLERRYNGIPAFLLPLGLDETLIVGSSAGRVGRAEPRELRIMVYDVLKTRKHETVSAAAAFPEAEDILAVSEHGEALTVQTALISANGPPASRGQTLRKNFRVIGLIRSANLTNAITSRGRLLQATNQKQTASKTKIFKLHKTEVLLTCW